MRVSLPRRAAFALSVLAATLLAGCQNPDSARRRSQVEYEYVSVIGSNMRLRVVKGQRPEERGSVGTATMDAVDIHNTFQVPQTTAAPPPTGG